MEEPDSDKVYSLLETCPEIADALPPLPAPHSRCCPLCTSAYSLRRLHANLSANPCVVCSLKHDRCFGLSLTCIISGFLLAITHTVVVTHLHSTTPKAIVLVLMYLTTATAFVCWGMLMTADPGVVKRTHASCYPQPERIAQLLSQGAPIKATNIVDTNADRSFCTRCLVWRPYGSHHCSACQRCVYEFDHHCGVLGVCIARDNAKYFKGLIASACGGFLICIGFVIYSLA